MAILWGSYDRGYRLGFEWVRTAQRADQEDFRIDAYVECYTGTYDYVNKWTVSGGASGSGTLNIKGGSTQYKIASISSPKWTRYYGQNRSISVSFSVTGLGSGHPPAVTKSFTVTARPYVKPAVPSNAAVTYKSDSQLVVSWTAGASDAAPVTGTYIDRAVDSGSFVRVATVSGSGGKTWTDTSTTAGHSYTYRVSAYGSGGTSGTVSTPTVYTTPLPPSNVKAFKNGDTNITLTWTTIASYTGVTYNIYEGSRLVGATPAGAGSYTVTGASSTQPHTYTVKSVAPSGLMSVGVDANSVRLATAPYQPTLSTASYVPEDDNAVLFWTYDNVDTSAQSQVEIQYTADVVSPTWKPLFKGLLSAQSWTADNETAQAFTGTVGFRVRVWGQDTNQPSPWSNIALIQIVTRPTATITAPVEGAVSEKSSVQVQAVISSSVEKNPRYNAVLSDGEQVLQQLSGVSAGGKVTVSFEGLENGHEYTVSITGSDYVLSLPATVTVIVRYAAPATPSLTVLWQKDTASVQVSTSVFDGVVATDTVSIERQAHGGVWEPIAEDLQPNAVFIDCLPPLTGTLAYRVVAVSELDTRSTSEPAIVEPQANSVYVNWDIGFQRCVRLDWNIEASTTRRLKDRSEYVFAGSATPTLIQGTAVNIETRISALLGHRAMNPNVIEQVRALQEASISPYLVAVRRPDWDTLIGWLEADTPRSATGVYTTSFTHHVSR